MCFLPRLTKGLNESLERRTALEYIEIFFKYLVKSTEVVGEEDYAQALRMLPEGGDKIMNTLAEVWKSEGKEEGKIENTQDLLLELLEDELDVPSQSMIDNIRSINSYEILRGLFKKARKVNSLEEFSQELDRVLKS